MSNDSFPELVNDFGPDPDFDINEHDDALTPEVVCEEPPAVVQIDNNLFAVLAEDARIAKVVLNNLKTAWAQASTVDEICKLSLTTMKVLEQRRTLMNLQLGVAKFAGGPAGGGYDPYQA